MPLSTADAAGVGAAHRTSIRESKQPCCRNASTAAVTRPLATWREPLGTGLGVTLFVAKVLMWHANSWFHVIDEWPVIELTLQLAWLGVVPYGGMCLKLCT